MMTLRRIVIDRGVRARVLFERECCSSAKRENIISLRRLSNII